ncbi:hypothetical protein [Streptomyces lydicus]|uniref:hypothetical protein n=1 Tax=Streptomyces lydicus TaxID=47763 RepID=UPI0036E95428
MTIGSPEPIDPTPLRPGYPPPAQAYLPPAPPCRYCGLPSAAPAQFRAITAFLFFMTIRTMPGPFCRTCGVATFRATTATTLALGWWGFPAFLLNLIFIGTNLNALRTVKRLPAVNALPLGPQLDVGKPLHRRPFAYIALVPLAWILFAIAGLITHAITGRW